MPNLWQYISIGLTLIIFSLGYYTFGLNSEINTLTKDMADQKVLTEKWKSKSEKQNTAIALQKTAEKENKKTSQFLSEEIKKLVKLDKIKNGLHRAEVKKYKKLIDALESEVVITGEIKVKDCKIKIMEVKNEGDIIGNSIGNIGF